VRALRCTSIPSGPGSLPTHTLSLCRGLRPSFSTPDLPRAGYLVRERVSVGVFSHRVSDSEKFDESRGESAAYSPKLVEKVFSEGHIYHYAKPWSASCSRSLIFFLP
jgi:hypothetical protein